VSDRRDILYIKHKVLGVPKGKTSSIIEKNVEYYQWTIYLDGPQYLLQKIERVEYAINDPSFFGRTVTRKDWRNGFSYSVFGYGNVIVTYTIFSDSLESPMTNNYYIDISKSNETGEEIPFHG
jgi:hypothetical protein